MRKKDLFANYLRQEGYSIVNSEDELIVFRYEGRTYVLTVDEDDSAFFQLIFPNFWSIDSAEERQRAYHAAAEVTKKVKVLKVYPMGDNVWASVELLLDPANDLRKVFPRTLRILQDGAEQFRALMQKAMV